ncbi:hypothetical protein ILUMI_20655 [Ignelater luminosus]|uniref:Transmembrane protein 138 n=1 Tax=Ignelater luminosus TaxID=2038154 RepID=A0A8K0CKE6_IGNLU|nr:hypothetical protein ILUMI_20655 [Ignelater luminosus]
MKLTIGRYSAILCLQTLLILIDIGINTFSVLVRRHNAVMLILFIVQDVCLIFALAALLLTFFFDLCLPVAPLYYYFYKRAALRISDPRFYEDVEWVQPSQGGQTCK